MLPDSRQSDYQFSIPEFNLGQNEIDDFMNELKGFYEQVSDCFMHSESRDYFFRYMVGQFFEEAKTELGMDHYEVRKFPGWHHHILTCMLAHFFLWHTKIRLGKKSTSYYAVAA
jgi:hypothetical protein